MNLTSRQKLRGYDAVQLAVALTMHGTFVSRQLPPLTLISADRDLLTAAKNEGLSTDDPNQYP